MKILIVSDYSTPTGGVEIYVLQLRTFLREAGHDVLLFSSSVGPNQQRMADLECWGSRKKFANRLLQTFNPFAYFKLRRVLREFKPDLIHLNLFLTQLSPSVFLAFKKTPVVYAAHLYKLICPLGSKLLPDNTHCTVKAGMPCLKNKCVPFPLWLLDMVQQRLIMRYLPHMDVILANSAVTQRLMRASGVPVTKIQPYFISTKYRYLPFPSTSPTICFMGRLVPEKGVAVLLQSMRYVVDELPEARLLIVGDGKEKQRLQILCKQLELDNSVEFLGYVPPEHLDKVWLRSQVQVVPSIWAEPFGLVAAEAMAVGRAVVATRGGGLEESVVDGESGFLVSPENVAELYSSLLALLRNPDLAESMGKRGSEIISNKLGDQENLTQLLEVYGSLLENNADDIESLRKARGLAIANNMNCEEGHLGGYIKASPRPAPSGLHIEHGDPATYTPNLWQWVYEKLGVRSVLDVGCGEGHCARFFRDLGCRVSGIDGSDQAKKSSVISESHIMHDFVNGPYVTKEKYDLVWSCEFVEHIGEQYVNNFLATFCSGRKFVMLTYASPGEKGWHHVNCQPASYWIDKLAQIGYTFDPDLTAESRMVAETGHFNRKGLFFVCDNSFEGKPVECR